MVKRKGYLFISLVLFFAVMALSSSLTFLESGTLAGRAREKQFRQNLASIRRGIDLYRHTFSHPPLSDSTKIQQLEDALTNGPASEPLALLASWSFISQRVVGVATDGKMLSQNWRIVKNLLKNPGYEEDGSQNYGTIGTWQGNFTSGDGVPNGWQLTDTGIEQMLALSPATYVISAWVKNTSANSQVDIKVSSDSTILTGFQANFSAWKRYYGSFSLTEDRLIRLEISQTGSIQGDLAFVARIMLETWNPPAGFARPPVPSAWTASATIASNLATMTLQQAPFNALINSSGQIASLSWWFEW